MRQTGRVSKASDGKAMDLFHRIAGWGIGRTEFHEVSNFDQRNASPPNRIDMLSRSGRYRAVTISNSKPRARARVTSPSRPARRTDITKRQHGRQDRRAAGFRAGNG